MWKVTKGAVPPASELAHSGTERNYLKSNKTRVKLTIYGKVEAALAWPNYLEGSAAIAVPDSKSFSCQCGQRESLRNFINRWTLPSSRFASILIAIFVLHGRPRYQSTFDRFSNISSSNKNANSPRLKLLLQFLHERLSHSEP